MSYVGKDNRELVSALISAIWSGSWFVSSRIFKYFRDNGLEYAVIFLITATLYTFGVFWYYQLIKEYEREKVAGKL
ncbi:MAG: hypothetical protein J0M08_11745 [Bacteroidetes bacterium]|nr:hypothetical protein [Bacteroidota bacterium]